MALEIERKFLVRTAAWRELAVRTVHITDGLVLASGERKLRVRICGGGASLTYKGAREGLSRDEFEYPIPIVEARQLMTRHCEGRILSKTRHEVPCQGFLWQVDVYDPPIAGMILAEIELSDASVLVPLPDWLGEEVTGQEEYRKINLLKTHRNLSI